MNNINDQQEGNPWYKEPWGIFVFAPLFIVVITCSIFVTIAFKHSDDVIKDGYVKTGKVYDKDFSLEDRAKALQISAKLEVVNKQVQVYVNNLPAQSHIEVLTFSLLHPLKEKNDLQVSLVKQANNKFVGEFESVPEGRWYVELEAHSKTSEQNWRIKSEIDFSQATSFFIQ